MWSERMKLALWSAAVWFFSFLCYAPMLMQRLGYTVPKSLLALKYGFVLVPALTALLFHICERSSGERPSCRFKRVSREELAVCGTAALAGFLVTTVYSSVMKTDLYGSAYPSALSLAAGCVYLLLTALAEETAWRGFLFHRLAAGGSVMRAALGTGVIWGIWHIPMWVIRNSLGLTETVPLLIWAVLLSAALGLFYSKFGSILSAALLHMTFNVCFLAPAPLNCAVLFLCLAVCRGIRKKTSEKFQ